MIGFIIGLLAATAYFAFFPAQAAKLNAKLSRK